MTGSDNLLKSFCVYVLFVCYLGIYVLTFLALPVPILVNRPPTQLLFVFDTLFASE